MKNKNYIHKCSNCNKDMIYSYKKNWKNACENKVKCPTCRAIKYRNSDEGYFERTCMKCNNIITYTTNRAYNRAEKKKSVCLNCHLSGDKMKQLTSDRCLGVKRPYILKDKKWRENLGKSVKKSYQNMDEDRKKDIFQKQFFTRWGIMHDEYMAMMPKYKRYRLDVRRITNNQPLEILENYEKRGKFDYHLDHIISIHYGYMNNIPACDIGDISNLQMLPWKDNLIKGNKLIKIDMAKKAYKKYK